MNKRQRENEESSLISEFFGAPTENLSFEQQAEYRRQQILAKIEGHIEDVKADDLEWQQLTHAVIGTLAMGALVLGGGNDTDGAEKWRWLREQVEEMEHEDLLGLVFE